MLFFESLLVVMNSMFLLAQGFILFYAKLSMQGQLGASLTLGTMQRFHIFPKHITTN